MYTWYPINLLHPTSTCFLHQIHHITNIRAANLIFRTTRPLTNPICRQLFVLLYFLHYSREKQSGAFHHFISVLPNHFHQQVTDTFKHGNDRFARCFTYKEFHTSQLLLVKLSHGSNSEKYAFDQWVGGCSASITYVYAAAFFFFFHSSIKVLWW